MTSCLYIYLTVLAFFQWHHFISINAAERSTSSGHYECTYRMATNQVFGITGTEKLAYWISAENDGHTVAVTCTDTKTDKPVWTMQENRDDNFGYGIMRQIKLIPDQSLAYVVPKRYIASIPLDKPNIKETIPYPYDAALSFLTTKQDQAITADGIIGGASTISVWDLKNKIRTHQFGTIEKCMIGSIALMHNHFIASSYFSYSNGISKTYIGLWDLRHTANPVAAYDNGPDYNHITAVQSSDNSIISVDVKKAHAYVLNLDSQTTSKKLINCFNQKNAINPLCTYPDNTPTLIVSFKDQHNMQGIQYQTSPRYQFSLPTASDINALSQVVNTHNESTAVYVGTNSTIEQWEWQRPVTTLEKDCIVLE